MNRITHFLLYFCTFLLSFQSLGQANKNIFVEFFAAPEQSYGFDKGNIPELEANYEKFEFENSPPYIVSFKSVGYKSTDHVRCVIHAKKSINRQELQFKIGERTISIDSTALWSDTFSLTLPKSKKHYALEVFYFDQQVGKLNVQVYSPKKEKIIIVPLTKTLINRDSLTKYPNSIYKQPIK